MPPSPAQEYVVGIQNSATQYIDLGYCHPAADELPGMQAHRDTFYSRVYGVVGDSGRLLSALLAKKERVAEAALVQIVSEALGM